MRLRAYHVEHAAEKTRRFPEPNILPRTWNDGHETPSPPPPPPPAPSHFPAQARGPEHDGGALMSVSRHSSPRQVMADRQAARAHAGREGGGAVRGGGVLGEGGGRGRRAETGGPRPAATVETGPTPDTDSRQRSTCVRTRSLERQQTPAGAPLHAAPPPPGRPRATPSSYPSSKPPLRQDARLSALHARLSALHARPPLAHAVCKESETEGRDSRPSPSLMTGIASWRVRTEAHRADPFGEREVCTPSPLEI